MTYLRKTWAAGEVLDLVYDSTLDAWLIVNGANHIASKYTLGQVIVGADLQIDAAGHLSVDKATAVSQDNTKPITAAAVYTEIGNINALLQTI